MKKQTFFLFIGLICTFNFAASQGIQLLAMRNVADYQFLLYLPADSIVNNKPPIIIYLHGRNQSGSNLGLLKNWGIIDAIERGRNIDAIVIAPQVPLNKTWEADKILSVLDYVQHNYDTDTQRVYVCGMSLGGYGTMFFAGKYPERVTAAVALCGGGYLKDACNLSKTVLWIQHGKKDRDVKFSESTKMYSAIKQCNPNANLFLTLYPNYAHKDLAYMFYRDTLYDWFYSYRKIHPDSIAVQENSELISLSPDSCHNPKIVLNRTGIRNKTSVFANHPVSTSNTTTSSTGKAEGQYYTIKKGDTLYAIAKRNNTTVKKLCTLNGISEKSILKIGQKIKLY